MTIYTLRKKLETLEKKYGPRTTVCVCLDEYRNVSDEFNYWKIHGIEELTVPWDNGNGRELANGAERMKKIVAIL